MAIAGLKETVSRSMRSDSSNGCSPGTPPQEQKAIRLPDLLRHTRESRGLTLEQLANEIKIPASRLAAFEHDDLPRNEIGFYLRAQIRAYARALNVDENVVLAELNQESTPLPAQRVQVEDPQTRMPALRVPRAPVAIGLVVAAVVAGRVMATLDVWSEADTDVRTVPASVLPSETPVPTSAAAADVPQVESGQAERLPLRTHAAAESDQIAPASSFERASGLELQALRTSEAPEAARATAPAESIQPTTANSATELVVTSEPPGARVTVNGIGWGATPITIRHLSAGPKRVRVTLDGFAAAEHVINVSPDRSRSVLVRLRPASE